MHSGLKLIRPSFRRIDQKRMIVVDGGKIVAPDPQLLSALHQSTDNPTTKQHHEEE